MEALSVFDDSFLSLTQGVVKTYQIDTTFDLNISNVNVEEKSPIKESDKTEKAPLLTCSSCKIDFKTPSEQRIHFKLDWHRYNVKQKLRGKQNISEEHYNEQIDDLSSTSGDSSSSDEEEETLNSVATAQGKIFLQKDDGTVFSLYKCLLGVKKEEISNETLNLKLKNLQSNKQWTVLMLGGGHFAGAVFQNGIPILHKTFHCYTVRAGQGGSQSSRDNRNATNQPKSAGASLRRYNESALVQHVKDIVETWQKEIEKSGLILYRASGPYNRSVLFGGKTPLLERNDSRLRTIPFSTKRANFNEVKRVYAQLTMVNLYKNVEEASTKVIRQRSPTKDAKRSKSNTINRAKSREIVKREIPGSEVNKNNVDSSNDDDIEFELNESEISFEDLKEYDDSFRSMKKNKKHKNANKMYPELCTGSQVSLKQFLKENFNKKQSEQEKIESKCELTQIISENSEQIFIENNLKENDTGKKVKKPKKSKTQKQRDKVEAHRKLLCEFISSNNSEGFLKLISDQIDEKKECSDENDILNDATFYSQLVDDHENTVLHFAASAENIEMVKFLLEKGSDPCKKNKKLQTPYTCTQNKEVRDVFKEFALQNLDKYNYNKAQIPIVMPPSEEAAEKKRLQRKAKRDKEKVKKKENALKKQEEDAEDRFAKMTDREKCALAAERRILNLGGKVILRCFNCGKDMSGLVPFTYNEYKFCAVDCLKAHRMKNVTL